MSFKMAHRAHSAAGKIIKRLSTHDVLSNIVLPSMTLESIRSRGGWAWLIDCGLLHIGSDHSRIEIAQSPGLYLTLIGTDQIDVIPIDEPCMRLSFEVEYLLKP